MAAIDKVRGIDAPGHGGAGAFLRHLLEMLGAMCLGCCAGGVLYVAGYRLVRGAGPFALLFARFPGAPLTALYQDLGFLVATGVGMVVPMVALMRLRGHGWERTAEMVGGGAGAGAHESGREQPGAGTRGPARDFRGRDAPRDAGADARPASHRRVSGATTRIEEGCDE